MTARHRQPGDAPFPRVVRIRKRHIGGPQPDGRDGSLLDAAFGWANGDKNERFQVSELDVELVQGDPASPTVRREVARYTAWLQKTWFAPYFDGEPVDPITIYLGSDPLGWYYHMGGNEDDPRA